MITWDRNDLSIGFAGAPNQWLTPLAERVKTITVSECGDVARHDYDIGVDR